MPQICHDGGVDATSLVASFNRLPPPAPGRAANVRPDPSACGRRDDTVVRRG
jgi:hypothetical protein